MKTAHDFEREHRTRARSYYGLASIIARAVTTGVTSAVTAAITFIVIILVLLVGLWLAYAYLPSTAFLILVVVIGADLLLGVILRRRYPIR